MTIKKLKISKTTKIVVAFALLMIILDWFYLRRANQNIPQLDSNLPSFNQIELAKYNGDDTNLPIYLVLDGYVYDVSAGRANFYGPGEAYHDLVGKDSSTLLHLVGGNIIQQKYSIVGVYKP
ncbi:MAG: cytochrome b5 domain-containing protein [bacterium]